MESSSRLASIPYLLAALGLVWAGCSDQTTYLECPPGTTPSGDHCEEIPDAAPGDEGRTFVAPCDPSCDDKECGDDGCGGTCGTCPEIAPACGDDGLCHLGCIPDCEGRECGPDGCVGSCGTCPEAAPTCDQDGQCQLSCTPDCAGRECGGDGCGGTCGTCPEAAPTCGADGQCQLDCTPDCTGKECGNNGCGGSCGTCPEAAPTCEEGTCSLVGTTGSGAPGEACTSCWSETDCQGGLCVPLGSGNVCLETCGSDNDCVTGWSCYAGSCAPAGFSCAGCLVDGCPGAQVCNTISGQCASPTASCDLCTYGWECGPTQACVKVGPGVRVCKPRCTNAPCSAGTTCVKDPDSSIDICDGGCATIPCNPACAGGTPHCVNSTCVQCVEDAHCQPGAICNTQGGFCESAGTQCAAPTPYFKNGQCVECLNATNCPAGTCDLQTGACGVATGASCASCQAPYPACAQVGGEWYCVQCNSDADCGLGGSCDNATYTCLGGTVTPTDPCTSDADCDSGITDFNLKCDEDSGYCHDTSGKCDDITAFCKGGGACLSLLDVLGGGGGGGGLPPGGLPGAGSTVAGYCECDPSEGQESPFPGFPGSSQGVEVCGDFSCTNLDLIFGFAGGGGGGAGSDTYICFDVFSGFGN